MTRISCHLERDHFLNFKEIFVMPPLFIVLNTPLLIDTKTFFFCIPSRRPSPRKTTFLPTLPPSPPFPLHFLRYPIPPVIENLSWLEACGPDPFAHGMKFEYADRLIFEI